MAANLAEEIRQAEENSKRIIQEAKVEAARLVAEARSDGEKRVKEAKQELHQIFRQEVAKAEAEAEKRADAIKAEGKRETESFVQARKDRVDEVASWLVEEVTAKYGLS
jgi:V/A-type H+-transporting ATPase subunit G/H